jgi:hypothetical protein
VTGENNWNGYENNLLFERIGDKEFADVARARGCDVIEDSRGVAVADVNGDGQLDLVINVNNNAAPVLLMNRVRDAGNFVHLKLIGGPGGNRDGIGARVSIEIEIDEKRKQMTRWVEAGTGYAAQSDMRLHFGLADAETLDSLAIHWPDGSDQRFEDDKLTRLINGSWVIRQGSSEIVAQRSPVERIALTQAR